MSGCARRDPGTRQRASEPRESHPVPAVPPALLTPEQHIQQIAQERSFELVLGSQQTRSHCPAPSSPLHLGASCHFPGPVTPHSLLHWCPDWYLVFKSFRYFPALLMWPDTRSIFFCLLFVSCVCVPAVLEDIFLFFLVYFGAQALKS